MFMFLVFGLFITAGGVLVCYVHHTEVTQSESFPGEIVGFKEKVRVRRSVIYKVYCPVVKFQMNGRIRTADHHSYERMMFFQQNVGDTVIVCVNPKMPRTFYFAENETRFSLGGVTAIVGGVLLSVLGIVLMAVL